MFMLCTNQWKNKHNPRTICTDIIENTPDGAEKNNFGPENGLNDLFWVRKFR